MVKSLKFLESCKKLNLVIYTCKLSFDKKTQKKTISQCESNINMNNYNDDYIKEGQNGYLMKMGTKLEENKYIVGLDIDVKEDYIETKNKKEIEVKNGMTKWIEILKKNYIDDIDSLITPIQKTGNNGRHYLFKLSEDDYKRLKTINGLFIDGIKYSIDFKANNQCLIVEPSCYMNDKGELKEYKWIKSPEDQPILYMPLFVYNMLLKSKAPKQIREKKTQLNINVDTDDELIKYKIDLLNNLSEDRFHNGNDWRFMARLFNNLDLSIELFDEYSKTSSKYISLNDCLKQYNKHNYDSKYNINTLINMSSIDDKLNHKKIQIKNNKIIQQLNLEKINNINNYDMIHMNQRYLINDIENKKLNINESEFTFNINKWMTNDNIKSLNINSSYDTGKTQLLKKIFESYNPEKVLFVSYRKTLSYDIRTKFDTYGFKSYMNEDLNSDKLIIQIESLHKLRNLDCTYISDEIDEIKFYDLIIIDEVESILNQFSSTTLGDKKKETFQLLDNLLFTANKIITLDGDMDNRTYDYISNYGNMLNIKNDFITHTKKIHLMKNINNFRNMIYEDLNNNKRIAIASMSSNEVEKINIELTNRYPNKHILIYTGLTSEEDKMELKNMDEIFKTVDVVLYSPTISAGVSYDTINKKEYFDKIYGIICNQSCTSRDFKQQLNRIRKINDDNIYVLNIGTMKNNNNISFHTFNDVKEQLLKQNDIIFNRQREIIINNGIKKVIERKILSSYDINYIHNIVEKKNNKSFYFIHNMELIFIKSGYEFNYIDDSKGEKIEEKNYTLDVIINADDIDNNLANELKIKQEASKTSKQENIILKKHFMKQNYGLNTIDEEIMKPLYRKENIYNNIKMILNKDNINITDDNYTLNKMLKVEKIIKIIDLLGFKSYIDVIDYTTFNKNLLNLYNSIEWTNIDNLFNDTNIKIYDTKLITFINNVFKNYGIELSKTKKIIEKPVLNKKGNQVIDRKTKQPKVKEVKVKGEYESMKINIIKKYYDLLTINIYSNKLKIDDSIKDLFIFNKDDNLYTNYIKEKPNKIIDECLFVDDEISDPIETIIKPIETIEEDIKLVETRQAEPRTLSAALTVETIVKPIETIDEKLLNIINIEIEKPYKSTIRKDFDYLDNGLDNDLKINKCLCIFDIMLQRKTCIAPFCYNEKRVNKSINFNSLDYAKESWRNAPIF